MPVFFTRKVQGESPRYFEAGANWGNAFRAHVIRAAPLSIVMSAACVRASGRLKMPRTAHWLTPFLTLPTASVSTNRWVRPGAGVCAMSHAMRRARSPSHLSCWLPHRQDPFNQTN